MKKPLLFIITIILSTICHAQIGPIQTTGENYRRVGQHMLNYPRTNRYLLLLQDGTDEVRLNLGVGPTEAAQSLANLYDASYEDGKSFTLQGRRYDINDKKVCVHDAYAIDGLCISDAELKSEILTLIMDYGAEFGELAITKGYSTNGTFMLCFETYGIVEGVLLGFDASERLYQQYNDFDKLSKDDVRVLRELIRENYTKVQNASTGIMVCDVILGEYN